jgi:hypothetical protein
VNDDAVNLPADESAPRHLTRRTALKGIGAGAAVAWTAPAILSSAAAFGASSGSAPCTSPCDQCFDLNATACGKSASGVPCLCSATAEGVCLCSADEFDANFTTCNSTADCPGGENCLVIGATGCDPTQKFCIPNCGAASAGVHTTRNGKRPSGRSG